MFALNIPTSSNVADLLAKKAELEASLKMNDDALNADRHLFIAQVHQLVKVFRITKDEAFPPSKEKAVVVDKDYSPDYFFRNPDTGEEWDGKGKRPAYLSGKKKTEKFRIYHATGTKFAPVVKTTSAQNESTSSVASTPLAIAPTAPFAAAMPEAQSLDVASANNHQPAMASAAITVDHSASALQTNASVETAASPS